MLWRRLVLSTALLAVGVTLPTLSAAAQSPNDPTAPPGQPVAPIVDDQGNEVVHSWALAPGGSADAGGVGNRPDLSYVADPGSVIADTVTLYNLSNVPLTFKIYATDAFNDIDGQFGLLGADETPVDVGSWVDLGGDEVPVPARTQVTIPITISIPGNAAPGDHVGAVLAANATVSTGADGQAMTLDRRTGPRLYVRVNGPIVEELAIADVRTAYQPSLNPLSGSATVTYRIENRGNVRLGGTTAASVGGPFGIAKHQGADIELPELLPGQSITLEQQFDDVAALGVAVTDVRLDPASSDGESTLASSSRSSIVLAPPIAVLLLFLALLFGVLVARAYRRHQQRWDQPHAIEGEVAVLEREPEHQPT
jgi:hypothetical protein